jgi:hypothetical protein
MMEKIEGSRNTKADQNHTKAVQSRVNEINATSRQQSHPNIAKPPMATHTYATAWVEICSDSSTDSKW